MSLNPNAKTFVFNAGAPTWTPKPAPSPAAAPVAPPQPPTVEEEEEIDENDPLWKAVLQHTVGNREEALKLLEDPDSLMQYPEIRAIMESSETANDEADWEKQTANISLGDSKPPVAPAASLASSTPSKAEVTKISAESPMPESVVDGDESAAVSTIDDSQLQDGDPREHLNIVFIGHVDAGKSTLSGSILYLMGKVDQRTIERYEKEAKQRNRESWFLAFIMDTSEEERAKGKTVEVGRAHFETEKNRYTILDAPGHKNYVPNMICGAAQADVGILVISARKGEFETGFEKGGQTREHALLAKTIGVQYLIVVINKMDDPTVNWDIGRYEECVTKLKPYLKSVGYTIKRDVKFIPISAIGGDNVLKEVTAEKCPWWKGYYTSGNHNTTTPTLLSTLDSLVISNRNPDGPLRIPCLDRYFERGCVVLGKVESGTLRINDEIVIAPTKKRARVEEIIIGEVNVRSAKPGENILAKFQINVEDIQKGYVLSHPANPCPAVVEIKVQLLLVDMPEHRPIFTPGYEAVMHCHTVDIEVVCNELMYVIEKEKKIRRPFARTGQVCVVKLTMPLHTCMEIFDMMPSLGRVTLRDEGRTIGIGKIIELNLNK